MRKTLVTLAFLTAGCMLTPADVGAEPWCHLTGDDVSDTVVLIAQAVPTAKFLPCVDEDALPSDWSIPDIEILSGTARIDISAGEMDKVAVSAVLRRMCDLNDAVSVPTDRTGTRRYDVPTDDPAALTGTRRYLFDGGCITYTYDLPSNEPELTVDDALLAIGLLPRDVVSQAVHIQHDSRLQLDPASPGAS